MSVLVKALFPAAQLQLTVQLDAKNLHPSSMWVKSKADIAIVEVQKQNIGVAKGTFDPPLKILGGRLPPLPPLFLLPC